MNHVLAPVPAVHLPSAEATFAAQGRVAFGSDAWTFWLKQVALETCVWIVASATDFPKAGLPRIDPGKVIFRGTLIGTVEADRRHRHPDPALRPANPATFGASAMFFELADLVRLAPPLPVLRLATLQGIRLQRVPQGPLAIRDPEAKP